MLYVLRRYNYDPETGEESKGRIIRINDGLVRVFTDEKVARDFANLNEMILHEGGQDCTVLVEEITLQDLQKAAAKTGKVEYVKSHKANWLVLAPEAIPNVPTRKVASRKKTRTMIFSTGSHRVKEKVSRNARVKGQKAPKSPKIKGKKGLKRP